MERVLKLGVWLSAALLATGLVLWLSGNPTGTPVLHAGLWVLIAAPVTRMLAALVGYVVERDWTFVALAAIVLTCLLFPIVRFLSTLPR